MRRSRGFWILATSWLAVLGWLTSLPLATATSGDAATTESPIVLPSFVGTWHVLIHYQAENSSHPERWKWDERVWVIEPAPDGGYEWVEHAIVTFQDPAGRFENLGTNRARRLIGAWEPNPGQLEEIAKGLAVSGRGMRRKRVREVEPGLWRSGAAGNDLGRSSSGLGYNEVWSIRLDEAGIEFAIDTRFTVSAVVAEESAGATVFRARQTAADRLEGLYARGDERRGRFRATPTRILIPESDDPTDARSRPSPLAAAVLEMVPDRSVQADVPILFSVLRPFHYYADRRMVIESTPPGAELDVAYLRRGSQLMYRRGRAPLELILPTRLQAASSDRILVRGFLPGHQRTRRSISVAEADEQLRLELPPLQNQLLGVAHGSILGRTVLELQSDELPSVRVAEDAGGWTIVLVQTGLLPEVSQALAALRDPTLGFDARQLGDDFVLRVEAPPSGNAMLRHQQIEDPSRGETRTRLVIEGADAKHRVDALRAAVAGMGGGVSVRCGAAYEARLHQQLAGARHPARLGRDDHPYRATLRAALRQLAASREEPLRTRNGDALGTATPLEFELAWSRSAEIEGYLIWLEDLASRIDTDAGGELAFRSLVAPDWSPARFAALLENASAAREGCLAKARDPDRS